MMVQRRDCRNWTGFSGTPSMPRPYLTSIREKRLTMVLRIPTLIASK